MTRSPGILFLVLLAAFLVHAALADNLELFGARPNLCVVALLICALYVGPEMGAALGLFAGMLEGSYTPMFLGSLVATRLTVGTAVGALEHRVFRDNAPFAFVTVVAGSIVAESMFYLFAPQPNAGAYFLGVFKQTAYHAVLSLPAYAIVSRFVHGGNSRKLAAKRP